MALWKIAYQSSIYQMGKAARTVDGNADNCFFDCSHTSDEYGAWWMVDLESRYFIQEVVITFSGGKIYDTMNKIFTQLSNY